MGGVVATNMGGRPSSQAPVTIPNTPTVTPAVTPTVTPTVNTTVTPTATTPKPEVKKVQYGPHTRALLDTIAYTEGTSKEPNSGYNTQFTGKQFKDLSKHPREKLKGGGHVSDAAGRYQFLSKTYDDIKMTSLEPEEQDRGAVKLALRRLKFKTPDELESHLKKNGMDSLVMDELSREWASFPDSKGKGRYGQPIKSLEEIKTAYDSSVKRHSDTTTPPSKQDTVPYPPEDYNHTVVSGDTLGRIAKNNNTTVDDIIKNNPDIVDPNKISVGQKVKLPKKQVNESCGCEHKKLKSRMRKKIRNKLNEET